MNWLTNFVKPKLNALVSKRKDVPENLWKNCTNCGNMIHHKDLFNNLHVCPSCNYHFRLPLKRRIEILFDNKYFKEIDIDKMADDPLNFVDSKKYKDRLKDYRKRTNNHDALVIAETKVENNEIIVGIMNFDFMGGSMGRSVGEGIVKAIEVAVIKKKPFIYPAF